MPGLRVTEGAPAPLFERLVDDNPRTPSEGRPLRTLSRSQLRQSIRLELGRLLDRWYRREEAFRLPDGSDYLHLYRRVDRPGG